jgi:hypothetical protein
MRVNRDEVDEREAWIQKRLGERKYRQLRMHLSGALRLLGELGTGDEPSPTKSKGEVASPSAELATDTTKAVAALRDRLHALSVRQRPVSMRQFPRVKRRRKNSSER